MTSWHPSLTVMKRGLPVSLDIPNDATPEELEELKAFDAWTRDGQPVED